MRQVLLLSPFIDEENETESLSNFPRSHNLRKQQSWIWAHVFSFPWPGFYLLCCVALWFIFPALESGRQQQNWLYVKKSKVPLILILERWRVGRKLGVTGKESDNVVQSRSGPTLCNLIDCSTAGFPVLHDVPVFAQTHVCWVSDAIQLSHPLLPPPPPALNWIILGLYIVSSQLKGI